MPMPDADADAGCRMPKNAKCQMPNAKCQMPNAGCRAVPCRADAGCETPNAKRQTPNAERPMANTIARG
jgi:hypothetical protein